MRKTVPPAPKTLSAEARKWWKKLASAYDFDDCQLLILENVLSAFGRMREAQQILLTDGLIITDRWGCKKGHPALIVERDCQSAIIRGWRALSLDLELSPPR